MIFRNDDVTLSTSPSEMGKIYGVIHSFFPTAEIWSAITVFSQRNSKGSVYKEVPFKNKGTNWFYKNITSVTPNIQNSIYKIASHGLFHINHSIVSRETQEMSILGSTSYLKSNKFVPPFNKYNEDTVDICNKNGIEFIKDGWLSMEHNKFDPNHNLWYFHSWRFTAKSIKEYLGEHIRGTENSAILG